MDQWIFLEFHRRLPFPKSAFAPFFNWDSMPYVCKNSNLSESYGIIIDMNTTRIWAFYDYRNDGVFSH